MQLRPAARRPCPGRAGSRAGRRRLVRRSPPVGHPVLVAQRLLVASGTTDAPGAPSPPAPVRTVSSTGLSGGADQQRAGPDSGSTGRPSTASDRVAGRARRRRAPASGRAGRGSDDSPRQHPGDPPARRPVAGQVGAQQARRRPGRRRRQPPASRRRARCRARRAPPRAGRRGRRGCRPRRPAAGSGRQHGRPVHAGHVRAPEVVAHQPAGLVVHLPPLGGRVDRDRACRRVSISNSSAVALLGGALDPVRSDGSTRRVSRSRTTSRVPSPVTA